MKSTSAILKRGTPIKNIRLTHDPAESACDAATVKCLVPKGWFHDKA